MNNSLDSSETQIQPSTSETTTFALTLRLPQKNTEALLQTITSYLPVGVSVARTQLAEVAGITITGDLSLNKDALVSTFARLTLWSAITPNLSLVGSGDADLTFDEYYQLAR